MLSSCFTFCTHNAGVFPTTAPRDVFPRHDFRFPPHPHISREKHSHVILNEEKAEEGITPMLATLQQALLKAHEDGYEVTG